MPPKKKITKEEISAAALALVRQQGPDALNARALAGALGCSTQPIFSSFDSMDTVRQAVLDRGNTIYQGYLAREIRAGAMPAYKASGMAYIRFAREEKDLFRLLFMRDRAGESIVPTQEWEGICTMIQEKTGLDREMAELFHMEMWAMVHGIATMSATGYLNLDENVVSVMLTDAYQGIKTQFIGRKSQ